MINVAYNDYNKTVLKDLKLPWIVSTLQLGLGLMFWVAPLWLMGLRKMPKISMDNVRRHCGLERLHAVHSRTPTFARLLTDSDATTPMWRRPRTSSRSASSMARASV